MSKSVAQLSKDFGTIPYHGQGQLFKEARSNEKPLIDQFEIDKQKNVLETRLLHNEQGHSVHFDNDDVGELIHELTAALSEDVWGYLEKNHTDWAKALDESGALEVAGRITQDAIRSMAQAEGFEKIVGSFRQNGNIAQALRDARPIVQQAIKDAARSKHVISEGTEKLIAQGSAQTAKFASSKAGQKILSQSFPEASKYVSAIGQEALKGGSGKAVREVSKNVGKGLPLIGNALAVCSTVHATGKLTEALKTGNVERICKESLNTLSQGIGIFFPPVALCGTLSDVTWDAKMKHEASKGPQLDDQETLQALLEIPFEHVDALCRAAGEDMSPEEANALKLAIERLASGKELLRSQSELVARLSVVAERGLLRVSKTVERKEDERSLRIMADAFSKLKGIASEVAYDRDLKAAPTMHEIKKDIGDAIITASVADSSRR
jgi:hypothetical protein